MSIVSLVIQEKGYKEIYPFASWKLFTVPSGGEASVDRYKLYGIKDGDTIRILNKTVESYQANDEESIVNIYGGKIEQNEDRKINLTKLLIFAKDTNPEFNEYMLYKETYNPKEIGEKKVNINKKLITKL
ncbi:hypothetical protein C1637_08195 [Chryseobacterium lactis]|uniref:Uncharacterized protein n=2 Tax=Chryseobacterium lactis TaxID=1241981 RepID=A0A3G6RLD0_CHRLC|nr:hypothetical protein EG342_11500 [Chryseobacterium lactis]AZB02864.1 hypothetical protein EG341_02360 [Chryseobacterium lactis]PNW13842.1 hypothetical protein C1637_08195 [Chryseobacterium lactis]